MACEPRLGEIVELYRSLGFEVRLGPVGPDDPCWADEGCTACLGDPAERETVKVVYTRRASGGAAGPDDGLFD